MVNVMMPSGHAAVAINELSREKINNVVSDQLRHKPTCTVTEKS